MNINTILTTKFDLRELIGITAGIFILASFIPKKEHIIRFINFFGCLIFVIYGAVMPSPLISVIVINSLLMILQVVYLTMYFVNKKKTKGQNPYQELTNKFNLVKENIDSNQKEALDKLNQEVINIILEKDKIISSLTKKDNKQEEKKDLAN